MAYTSDFRLKNLIKDIHSDVINDLKSQGFDNFPTLRIFDESKEDSILFDKGGLTFVDPLTNNKFGSNDAAWIYDGNALVVVEGTFGTERGQFGDGQLNRFSHSTGVAVNGAIGVTLIPLKGESYSKSGSSIEGFNERIKLKFANIHKGFLKGAIEVNKNEKGHFLVIDTYNPELLKKIVIESFKKNCNKENTLDSLIDTNIKFMKEIVKDYEYGSKGKGLINELYDNSNRVVSKFSRIYTQNFAALTDSSKRDGHGLFGKCLIESYLSGSEKYFAIFIRMNSDDFIELRNRKQKEFKFIDSSSLISNVNFDQLIFDDEKLKNQVLQIKNINLFRNRQDDLLKKIKNNFNLGKIRLSDR